MKVLTSLILPHRPYNRGRRHFVGSVQVSTNNLAQILDLGEVKQALFDSLLVGLEDIGGIMLDAFGCQTLYVLQCLDSYLSGSLVRVADYRSIVGILGNLSLAWECAVWSARCGGDGSVVRFLDPGNELDLELIVTCIHLVEHVGELEDHLHVLDRVCFVGVWVVYFLQIADTPSQRCDLQQRLVMLT